MRTTLILLRSQELCARTWQCKTLQVMITLQLRAPNGHSNFYSTARGTLRDTHRIHVYYVNECVTPGPWNSWGTISWSWNSSECNIWESMGQSWYEWYNYKNSWWFPTGCDLHWRLQCWMLLRVQEQFLQHPSLHRPKVLLADWPWCGHYRQEHWLCLRQVSITASLPKRPIHWVSTPQPWWIFLSLQDPPIRIEQIVALHEWQKMITWTYSKGYCKILPFASFHVSENRQFSHKWKQTICVSMCVCVCVFRREIFT